MGDWYTHGGYPAQGASGDSASARTEFDAIQTAMNKLPAISASGGRLIRVNAGGTALESVTAATAALETYDDNQKGTHTILSGVAGTNTITATAAPTLTAYTTGERFVFFAAGANTGAATLNIDGLGAVNIVLPDGSALVANDILGANYPCKIIKRAADFVLLNPFVSASLGLHSGVSKGTPVGADELSLWDSVTQTLQKLSFTNLIAYLSSVCSSAWTSQNTLNSGGQIPFPAAQNASANVNVLDDYEEGSWTPVMGGALTTTYTTQVGRYVKIGKLVFCSGTLVINSIGDSNGRDIGGFPFAFENVTNEYPVGSIAWDSAAQACVVAVLRGTPNASIATIYSALAASASLSYQVFVGSGTTIRFNILYRTDN